MLGSGVLLGEGEFVAGGPGVGARVVADLPETDRIAADLEQRVGEGVLEEAGRSKVPGRRGGRIGVVVEVRPAAAGDDRQDAGGPGMRRRAREDEILDELGQGRGVGVEVRLLAGRGAAVGVEAQRLRPLVGMGGGR